MLSYRHAFHAGNFADVLKHIVLIQLIDYLKLKDKPFVYFDSHAGAGKYNLNTDYAQKTKEFEAGIGKLWQRNDPPNCVADYLKWIKVFNNGATLTHYPGSPLLAQRLLRRNDRLVFFELHSTDYALLAKATKQDKRIVCHPKDGFKESLKFLPPHERRGLILIDPSYEIKSDYRQAIEALSQMHKRFATGIYALWYPVIERSRNQQLEKAIQSSGIKNVQLFELSLTDDASGHGMTASGVIVINPPWTLADKMQQTLPWLANALTDTSGAHYRIERLVQE